jgi:integrase
MSELRDRMIADMRIRHFSARTEEAYVAAVVGLARYYRKRPDTLTDEELHRYLLHVREERRLSASTCNQIRCGLRFFYGVTLQRPAVALAVPLARPTQRLPEILSRAEVARVPAAAATLREELLLMTTYGGGLRVSEVVRLRPSDLDAERGLIRVEQGKGKTDRYTLFPRRVGALLGGATRRSTGRCGRGSFRSGAGPSGHSTSRPLRRCTTPPSAGRGLPSRAGFMRCGMRLRRTCSKRASTWRRSNACSGTAASRRGCATCT